MKNSDKDSNYYMQRVEKKKKEIKLCTEFLEKKGTTLQQRLIYRERRFKLKDALRQDERYLRERIDAEANPEVVKFDDKPIRDKIKNLSREIDELKGSQVSSLDERNTRNRTIRSKSRLIRYYEEKLGIDRQPGL